MPYTALDKCHGKIHFFTSSSKRHEYRCNAHHLVSSHISINVRYGMIYRVPTSFDFLERLHKFHIYSGESQPSSKDEDRIQDLGLATGFGN